MTDEERYEALEQAIWTLQERQIELVGKERVTLTGEELKSRLEHPSYLNKRFAITIFER